uniref:Uncharacterized protein n=1 Tax=Arion vulgaris TaxID=1028688 RepID=A0A0B6XYT5_9EUPU
MFLPHHEGRSYHTAAIATLFTEMFFATACITFCLFVVITRNCSHATNPSGYTHTIYLIKCFSQTWKHFMQVWNFPYRWIKA